MEISVYVAVFSAGVSVIAMFITLWQAILANKTYSLEKKKREDGQPNFKIDSMKSKAIIGVGETVRLTYYVVISNLSDKDMTIKDVSLRIIGEEKMIVLKPKNAGESIYIGDNIQCNKSLHNWIEFKITKDLYYDLGILKFIIEIKDIYENKQDTTIIYMDEEVHENA